MSPSPGLPTFMVIGGHRCATRWLRNNLEAHPAIHIPRTGESYFGNGPDRPGLRGYRLQFHDAGEATVVGDVSSGLLARSGGPSDVSTRIHALLPDVRLVALVRQPVGRMVSAYRDLVVHGRIDPTTSLYELVRSGARALEQHDLVGGGLYAANLYPFRRRFGDQLLIIPVDDVRDDPAKVYDAVLDHIGAPLGFVPPHLERTLYSNAETRWAPGAALDDDQRRTVHMLFRHDVEELEAMLGRYLPAWDPGPPPVGWQDEVAHAEQQLRSF